MYIMFMPMLIISSMMGLMMKSWFMMWMIMEINLISLMMIMLFDKLINYEMLMKYFLFQSFNSYLYLLNSLGMFIENFNSLSLMMMNLSMLMKMSIIPFHLWYMKIILNLNWMNIFNMTTINKVIPLLILNNILNYNNMNILLLNFFMLLISSLISSILGIDQINLKLIMSYSSMIQISWIIILLIFNEMLSFIYFFIYMFISFNIFFLYYKLNLNMLIQINSIKMNNNKLNLFMMMLMFSLSNIPPILGFLMKWIHMEYMMKLNISFYYMFIMIISSLISSFFYFRIMFINLMNYFMINKMNFKFLNYFNNFSYKLLMMNWFNFIMIIMYEII